MTVNSFENDETRKEKLKVLSDALERSYFLKKENVANSTDKSYLGKFFQIIHLMEDYSKSDEKEATLDKISTILRKDPYLNLLCYKGDNAVGDFITFSFNMKEPELAFFFMKEEDKIRDKIETAQERSAARMGEKDDTSPDDDYEPSSKELLLMMYGTRGKSFNPTNETGKKDLASQMIERFNINPHKIVNIWAKKEELKTTPFMYFLQKNYIWACELNPPSISIPTDMKSAFYRKADFSFRNFEGDNLTDAIEKAGFGNPTPEDEKEQNNDSNTEVKNSQRTRKNRGKGSPFLPGFDPHSR